MRICIDAGHNYSGADAGAVGFGGLKEQNVTFGIAQKLKEFLSDKGHEVIMTRDALEKNLGTTVAQSLQERVNISNGADSDFFISIHCNSGVASASGVETLISQRGGLAESYAGKIQNAISTSLNMTNRGVRVDTEYLKTRLFVLHNTLCPAVLIETGFITNQSDAKKLSSQQDDFALSIASAFDDISSPLPFSDIKNHWSRVHIEKLFSYGIVNGFSDGTFRPDEPITRAQAAAMVSNALSVLGK